MTISTNLKTANYLALLQQNVPTAQDLIQLTIAAVLLSKVNRRLKLVSLLFKVFALLQHLPLAVWATQSIPTLKLPPLKLPPTTAKGELSMETCTRCPPIRSPQGGEWHKKKRERKRERERVFCSFLIEHLHYFIIIFY